MLHIGQTHNITTGGGGGLNTAHQKFGIFFFNLYNNTVSTLKWYVVCIVFRSTPDNYVYIRDKLHTSDVESTINLLIVTT